MRLPITVLPITVLLMVACRPAGPAIAPTTPAVPPASVARASAPPPVVGLPPVPAVRGEPLAPRLQYPSDNQLLAVRDSTFVLGSIGSGDAQLTINGVAVPVAPNGAFIAWLPIPPATAPRYDLVATRGADTARRTVRVRYPTRVALPATGPRLLDSTSVAPAPRMMARADEWVRVSVRAAANARVEVELPDGARRPLLRIAQQRAIAARAAEGPGNPIVEEPLPTAGDVGVTMATDLPAALLSAGAKVVASRGSDTVRLAVPAVQLSTAQERTLGVLRTTNRIGADTDHVVHGRTIPDGTYKWLLLPGTVLEITGKQNGSTRVRLDAALDVWVANEDIVALPAGSPLPRRVSGGLRVIPAREWVDLVIPLGERPAFLVEPEGRQLDLTLYGVQLNPEITPILGNDTLVRRIHWDQVGSDRVRLSLALSSPVYGWLPLWDEARRALVLRVRRPPVIDAKRPLSGLTIAVDPGHPPAGSTGPTGLFEGDAVLPVGQLLQRILTERGATAVLLRETLGPVGLTERAVATRRMNAHAFISIHLNALPDGVNPFTAHGTSTLFYHQPSEALARPVQSALVARFGLPDLGVHYQNLAVARPSWYPAVLTEGLFVIMPEQEAAMRDAGFQRRYAEALADGLEAYFRALGRP